MKRLALTSLLLLSLAACDEKEHRFTEAVTLHDRLDAEGEELKGTGEVLSAAQLNQGRAVYVQYCLACHGDHGDGRGPSSNTMRPPPRNFVQAQFKFTGTGYGELPATSALKRTIRRGLDGTPMLPWELTEPELDAVVAYLKTLSPRWKEEGVKPDLEIAPDPWAGKDAEAIALGRRVYHVAMGGAGCAGCHASFEPTAMLGALYVDAGMEAPTEFPATVYDMALKESAYPVSSPLGRRRVGCDVWLDEKLDPDALTVQVDGVVVDRDEKQKEGWDIVDAPKPEASALLRPGKPAEALLRFYGKACAHFSEEKDSSLALTRPHRVLPVTFLFQRVKSAYPVGSMVTVGYRQKVPYTAAMQREDLYRTIGAGIGGAAMPGWKGVLSEEKIWALVYYVQSLQQLRGSEKAVTLRRGLQAR